MKSAPGFILAILTVLLLTAGRASAHCDGLDGPVVRSAVEALKSGNVNLVLIWVKPEYENEIRDAFKNVLVVRKQSSEAREMADMYFFETLVRLHRLGEGASYTGLKPAGRDLGPAIPLADKSIQSGSDEQLRRLLTENVEKRLDHHFKEVIANKNYDKNNISAGRGFVESYVKFMHYVEEVYKSAQPSAPGHAETPEGAASHHH